MFPERRLIHRIDKLGRNIGIGGPPYVVQDVNKEMDRLKTRPKSIIKEGESALDAMTHAVPKEITDRMEAMIRGDLALPTRYTRDMAVQVYRYLIDPQKCWTLKAISYNLGINDSTMQDWMRKHQDLALAVEAGRATQEVNFGSMLLHGFKYSSGVEFILSNLHNWTTKQKTEHAIDLNAAIAAQEQARNTVVWADEQVSPLERAPWDANQLPPPAIG
jgi:transposase-like protein